MQLFFSVGEPSGDQHAAHLMQELRRQRPDATFSGYGGPLMERAGCRLDYRLTDLAVMGFARVLPLLRQFYGLVKQAEVTFRSDPPDAVVLVDFPGFNWWIARKAKAAGIPVFYYLPPQLWAWAPWRIRRMRKFVDHVLCSLPFETDWYAARGMTNVEYVGHPFFDEVADHPLDAGFCRAWRSSNGKRTVGVLPGSRNSEIDTLWPLMLRIMQRVHDEHPAARFLVACYKPEHREKCKTMLRAAKVDLPLHLFTGKTPEIIESADCCLMASGSVSLEMLARATPAVVFYHLSPLLYPIVRPLVRLDSMTLPNLISGRRLLPEYLVSYRPGRDVAVMADVLTNWLNDEKHLAGARADLAELRDEIVRTGATRRAAASILNRLPAPARRAAA
ncbi:MAG: lipid-A-disaccharide synthase [Planctomycetaceae bacterium]